MKAIKNQKIAVGLSGGVDSSVAAAFLKDQGHEVIGVHMLRWDGDIPGCTGSQDRQDALKVAKKLGISFRTIDFQSDYKKYVVDRFLSEIEKGYSPNPDVWCNEYIKFGVFLDYALNELNVDKVATGHYARVGRVRKKKDLKSTNQKIASSGERVFDSDVGGENDSFRCILRKGVDSKKDQSYFLYRLTNDQLSHTIFPLGDKTKNDVRTYARSYGLSTADKKDSVGICFIGDIDVSKFIAERITLTPGNVLSTEGEVIGSHDGVQLYTVGQRSGFTLTSYKGDPLYVVKKNINKNELVVGRGSDSDVTTLVLKDVVGLICKYVRKGNYNASVRIRHLGEIVECVVSKGRDGTMLVRLTKPLRGVSPGQHAVIYKNDDVVGGGVIS